MADLLISSTQNPRVKAVRKLHEPKGRRREGLFLLEGTSLVAEAVKWHWPLAEAFATPAWLERHPAEAAAIGAHLGAAVVPVADFALAAMSTLETPEGILAVARLPGSASAPGLSAGIPPQPQLAAGPPAEPGLAAGLPPVGPGSLWLVADAIQDPGNLGAIIRTADAAGAEAVVIGPGTVDPFAPRTVRASMGSVLHLPIVAAELAAARQPGMRWIALAPRAGKSLYEADLSGPIALWVGNEAAGLSPEAVAAADETVFIPMRGRAESLNAAASVAIALFEAVRQRS